MSITSRMFEGDADLLRMRDFLPPPSWSVRHVGDESEWGERVETHREVWQPSRATLEAYRRLRCAPVYDGELDIVAVAPSGTCASYCICWLDHANRCGEFEPVGTRPAFRRQRISRAVMLEGLHYTGSLSPAPQQRITLYRHRPCRTC